MYTEGEKVNIIFKCSTEMQLEGFPPFLIVIGAIDYDCGMDHVIVKLNGDDTEPILVEVHVASLCIEGFPLTDLDTNLEYFSEYPKILPLPEIYLPFEDYPSPHISGFLIIRNDKLDWEVTWAHYVLCKYKTWCPDICRKLITRRYHATSEKIKEIKAAIEASNNNLLTREKELMKFAKLLKDLSFQLPPINNSECANTSIPKLSKVDRDATISAMSKLLPGVKFVTIEEDNKNE